MKALIPLAAVAVLLAGCGADAPPPPSENPMLFDDIKPVALYDHVTKAEETLTGEAAKLKTTCHEYYNQKAFAQATGADAARFELSPGVEKSCGPYRAQLAGEVGTLAGLQLTSGMFADPLVWAKVANGKRAAFFRYDTDKNDKKPDSEEKTKKEDKPKSTPDRFNF